MKVNAMAFAKLLKYMQDGTLTCYELAQATGLHLLTVYDYTKALHKEGVVYICDWDGEGRNQSKIYRLGEGKDVRRPHKPRTQVYADYKERVKARRLQERITKGLTLV